MDESLTLSILMAVMNEEGCIEECVRRIFAVYPEACEVLVIDGGNDRTGEIVQSMMAEFPRLRYVPNPQDRGKGHATKTGIAQAGADIMVEIDADLQFLPEQIPRLIAPILEGRADVCLGSRFSRESEHTDHTFLRSMGNYVTSLYASLLYWHRMRDVLAGMSAWTRHTIETINLVSDNYSYEVEIPVKALHKGLRVMDVPITTHARKAGQSNVRVVRSGLAILRDITLFRLGLR